MGRGRQLAARAVHAQPTEASAHSTLGGRSADRGYGFQRIAQRRGMLAHLAVLTPRDHLRRRARDRRHGRRGVPVHRRRRRRAPLQAPRRRVRARRPSRAIIELRLGFIAERASVGGRVALEAGASQRGCRRRRLSITRGSRRRRRRGRCRRRRIHADPRPLSQDRGSLSKEEKNTRVPKAPNLDEETDLDGDLKGLRGSNAPTPVPGGGDDDDGVDARARPSDDEDEEVREEPAGDQTKKVDKSKTEDEPRAPSLDDETKVPTSKSSPPQHASGKSASDTKADGDDVFEPEESDDKNKSDDKKRPATKTQDEEPKDPKDSKDGDGDSGADSGADSASPAAKTNATKEEKEPLIVSVEDGEDHADVPPSAKSAAKVKVQTRRL